MKVSIIKKKKIKEVINFFLTKVVNVYIERKSEKKNNLTIN